jgi:hypothetical protein
MGRIRREMASIFLELGRIRPPMARFAMEVASIFLETGRIRASGNAHLLGGSAHLARDGDHLRARNLPSSRGSPHPTGGRPRPAREATPALSPGESIAVVTTARARASR